MMDPRLNGQQGMRGSGMIGSMGPGMKPSQGGSQAGGLTSWGSKPSNKQGQLSRAAQQQEGWKIDPRTGQIAEGCNVGEQPLPGRVMSADECRGHGLPPGSRWVDNQAAMSKVHPLFDPNKKVISWDDLPSSFEDHPPLPPASSVGSVVDDNGYRQQPMHGGYDPRAIPQIAEYVEPKPLNSNKTDAELELLRVQKQLGGNHYNLPLNVLRNMNGMGENPLTAAFENQKPQLPQDPGNVLSSIYQQQLNEISNMGSMNRMMQNKVQEAVMSSLGNNQPSTVEAMSSLAGLGMQAGGGMGGMQGMGAGGMGAMGTGSMGPTGMGGGGMGPGAMAGGFGGMGGHNMSAGVGQGMQNNMGAGVGNQGMYGSMGGTQSMYGSMGGAMNTGGMANRAFF